MKRIFWTVRISLLALVICQLLPFWKGMFAQEPNQKQSEIRIGNLKVNKLLILGNSVALHGPAPQIGWNGNWGMAASSREKDFAHVLHSRVSKATRQEPELLVLNLADFERKQTDFDFDQGLKESLSFEADVVIVAVGANAPALESDDAKQRYRSAFEQLLSRLRQKKSTTLLVRGEFWPDLAKEQIMREVCEKAGGTYVPLLGLNKEPANLGSADQKFEHAGVAGHPGDRGMRLIANELWNAIEKIAKQEMSKRE
jgi:lysophospholipase L1-like esterase